MVHNYAFFVCLIITIRSGDANFYIERLVDPTVSYQPPEPPYHALDLFSNPSGCSFFVSTTCRRLGASCEGLFSCCFCECPKLATFISLQSGCKEGEELEKSMKALGLTCQFVSVALPGGIPSYLKQEDLEAGLQFTLHKDAIGGVKLTSQETTCSGLRLFYVNTEGKERLVSDNGCSGVFTVKRDLRTNGWTIKWNPKAESKLWALLSGKLLKFEIKCILNKSSMETLLSCLYVKVSGRYNDETAFPAIEDMSCPDTTIAPSTTSPSPTTNFSKTMKTMLLNATEVVPPSPKQSQSSSTMTIVGGAIGAFVFLLIVVIAIVILVKRMKSRKANHLDVYYSRPIMNYSDSPNGGTTDPRYHMNHRVPKQPEAVEDAEYAVIEDALPQDGPEYACADAVLPKVTFKHGPKPAYQESANPYYRPASGSEYKAVPCDGMEKDNEAYLSSVPTAHPNLYEPSSSMSRTFGGSHPTASDTNPMYDSPNLYEDMRNGGN